MDEDMGILEETALEEMSAAFEQDIDWDADVFGDDADAPDQYDSDYDEDDALAYAADVRMGVWDDFPDPNEY